jgi:hypothetical protein
MADEIQKASQPEYSVQGNENKPAPDNAHKYNLAGLAAKALGTAVDSAVNELRNQYDSAVSPIIRLNYAIGGQKFGDDVKAESAAFKNGEIVEALKMAGKALFVDGPPGVYNQAVDKIADAIEWTNEQNASLSGKVGGPKAKTLIEEATLAEYSGRYGEAMEKSGEATKLIAGGAYDKATDAIATAFEKGNELNASLAEKLGGPKAKTLIEEATLDMYSMRPLDAMKKSGEATVLIAEGSFAKGTKMVAGLFGHSSSTPKEPDPHHPTQTPYNKPATKENIPSKE